MKVILFDIDRTLVHDGGAGKKALFFSFKKVFGIDHDFGIMAGKTDSSILKQALKANNIEENKSRIADFKKFYYSVLLSNIEKDLPGKRVCIGANKLLKELGANNNIKMGLLTGNWKEGAYIKLGYFGLADYFSFGAFADDAIRRNDLFPFAVKRCNDCTKLDLKEFIIIGDTPKDIECAMVHGCRSLGVGTGRFSTQELIKNGADHAVDDLAETEEIASWILNN